MSAVREVVPSSGVSTIRSIRLDCGMTIASLQPDPGARPHASDGATVIRAARPARRLRLAPPVQLELVCEPQASRPEVWAALPEQTKEAVLVLLARLIDAGAVEQEEVT